MGAITQAMARAARGHGAEIETEAGVREVIVEGGRAAGVVLDNGKTIRAKYVVSGVNPKLLYTRLVPSGALAPEFLERIARWRNGSGTFRMNVALNALPSFTALPGAGDHLTAGIILAPSLGYMDRAWQDARSHGWSREPVVEVLIPSTLDDSLAPEGQHVASLFCQHVAPELPDGKSWDDHRDEVADLQITASMLAHTGGPPPDGVWERLESIIAATPPPLRVVPPTVLIPPSAPAPEIARPDRRWRWLAAAAAVVALVFVGIAYATKRYFTSA